MFQFLPFLLTALSVAGTVASVVGQIGANEAQTRAEAARKRQMDLDAARRRREIIRQSQVARSVAVTNAAGQGAGAGSGIQGGIAQITGQAARETTSVNQNQEIGTDIFNQNAVASGFTTIDSIGGGMRNLSQTITNNRAPIGRIFNERY